MEQLRFALGLPRHRSQFLLNPNHLARMSVRELERFDELGFRQFSGRAFDHDHIVFGTDITKTKFALPPCGCLRLPAKLAFHSSDAQSTDWPGNRNTQTD